MCVCVCVQSQTSIFAAVSAVLHVGNLKVGKVDIRNKSLPRHKIVQTS